MDSASPCLDRIVAEAVKFRLVSCPLRSNPAIRQLNWGPKSEMTFKEFATIRNGTQEPPKRWAYGRRKLPTITATNFCGGIRLYHFGLGQSHDVRLLIFDEAGSFLWPATSS